MNERLKKFINLIHQDIDGRRLRTALARIMAFAKEQNLPDITAEAHALDRRYYYMLRSMAQGMPDPDQARETAAMLESALILGERAYRRATLADSDTLYASYVRYASLREGESVPTLAVDFLTEHAAVLSDPGALLDSGRRAPLERLSRDIFHRIWVEYPLDEDSCDAILNLISEDDIPQADREAWLSAVTLGLLERYDPRRFRLLEEASRLANVRLRAAALTGLFWGCYRFASLNDSPAIAGIRRRIQSDPEFAEDMRTVVYEYSRQLGAAAIARRVENEILPRINSLGAEMMRRLGNIDFSTKSPEEIQELLGGSGLPGMADENARRSMQNINDLAEEGDDVFFSFLKPMHHQNFFSDIANWWLPFDTTRSEFAEIFDGEGAALGEMFDRLGFMCDSDKYAILMAVAAAPQSMRAQSLRMMVDQYGMIADQMPRADEDAASRTANAIANYMKNAYRFYHLFRRKGEVYNPFAPTYGFNSSAVIAGLYTDYASTLGIAERLYKSGIRPFAFPFYLGVASARMPEDAETLLHASDAADSAEYRSEAIEWLYRAHELAPSREDITLKLAELLAKNGRGQEVLKLFDGIGEENITSILAMRVYANRLSEAGRNDEALNILSKALYLHPDADEASAIRLMQGEIHLLDGNPLAGAELFENCATGKADEAAILRLTGTSHLASREPDKAFSAYSRSLRTAKPYEEIEKLEAHVNNHRRTLKSVYGITDEEINGMLDALKYSIYGDDIPFV